MNVGPLNPGDVSMNLETRPRPIQSAANEIRTWVGLASTLLSALASAGVLLSADQVTALQGILACVVPLVTAGATALTAFGIVRRSEPLVTPMSDPRDNDGTALVAVGQRPTAGGVLR